MQRFPRHRTVQFHGCTALRLLADSAEGVRSVIFAGGCTALVHSLEIGLGATAKYGMFLEETQEILEEKTSVKKTDLKNKVRMHKQVPPKQATSEHTRLWMYFSLSHHRPLGFKFRK